jgi:hypothetical protein
MSAPFQTPAVSSENVNRAPVVPFSRMRIKKFGPGARLHATIATRLSDVPAEWDACFTSALLNAGHCSLQWLKQQEEHNSHTESHRAEDGEKR